MTRKAGPARDPFTFSLGGMTAIASFVPAPAIASDRIRARWAGQARRDAEAAEAAPKRTEADCPSAA